MINSLWLELLMPITNFNGPKDVRAFEVGLLENISEYILNMSNNMSSVMSISVCYLVTWMNAVVVVFRNHERLVTIWSARIFKNLFLQDSPIS